MAPFDAGRVPRPIQVVAALSLVAGVVMVVVGGFRIGVTSDEPLHVQRFNNYLATGWYLGDGQVAAGDPIDGMKQQYVYAPATTLLLHGIGVAAGVEEPRAAASTADAYAARHLGIAMISLIGVLAVAATARLLLGRWGWGLVAAAVMVAVPLWTGHAMFNVKDVPVATGYAVATLGLALIARERRPATRIVSLGGPAALALGTFLCVGTRPGMWAGIAASCGTLVLCRALARFRGAEKQEEAPSDLWRIRDVTVALAAAAAGLWAIYPQVFGSPIEALIRSASGSANFIPTSTSWSFIPSRVAFQMPLLILALVAVGTVIACRELVAARSGWTYRSTLLTLVLVQMSVLPVIGIVKGANLYGDLRQVLFALPGAVVLATVGIGWLVAVVRRRADRDRTGPPLVSAVVCVALALPVVDQALTFPYNYAHYNPLANITGLTVLGDYYRASAREVVEEIPAEGRVICSPEDDGGGGLLRLAHLDGWVDCAESGSLLAPYDDRRRGSARALEPDEFWAVTFASTGRIGERCVEVESVTRRTLLRTLGLATLSRCRTPFPVLSEEVLQFRTGSDRGLSVPDRGWRSIGVDGTEAGLLFSDGPGTMTFGLSEAFSGRQVRLVLEASAALDVGARFGGRALPTHQLADARLAVDLPRDLVTAAIAGPLTLELTPGAGQPGGVKLVTMRVQGLSGD